MRKMLHFLRIYLPWTDIPTRMYSPRRYLPKINNIEKKLRQDEIKEKLENIQKTDNNLQRKLKEKENFQKTENNLQRILKETEKNIEDFKILKIKQLELLKKMKENEQLSNICPTIIQQVLYVGELAPLVRIFLKLKMLDKSKNNRKQITVVEFEKMVEERSEYLLEKEIKKWQDFRQKLNQGNINVKELEHKLKVISEWENKMRILTNSH